MGKTSEIRRILIGNAFNTYFASIGEQMADRMPS